MKRKNRIIALFLVLCTLMSIVPISAITAFAEGLNTERENAMTEIEKNFSSYQIGEKQKLADDGYIGIPVEFTVYFDSENHTAVTGYNGTPLMIYVVNTMVERIGTDSDAEIITDMLSKGYIVYVLDYLNNEKATSPKLDYSVQGIRTAIEEGRHRVDTTILPSGYYYDNFVVPAGYNVSIRNIFFEIDKHAADGTLEKIVEIWNNDFKTVKKDKLVKWVHADGTRKTVADATDGSSHVWYADIEGKTVDNENGQYTKVKYTVAEKITDCVNPDGTPIDLNQYMHIVYPTGGVKSPVMCLANSGGRVTTSNSERPHMNGFLFKGYTGIVYDYLWTPMSRNDSFGYFDGSGGNTGDHMNYSVKTYNDVEVDTAAMRYIRYLALSDSETYGFDIDAIGVYGNSKGGWFTAIGNEVFRSPLVDASAYNSVEALEDAIDSALTSFEDGRIFPDHVGESRYQNGITESYTEDGVTIMGGEKQPWLTYNGEEILSGANLIYLSNGANEHALLPGYAPTFLASHLYDTYGAAYGFSNRVINILRNQNVPSMFFEVPLGHTFVSGKDQNYGVDTYDALFDFCGYYMKHDPVKVTYVSPVNALAGVKLNQPITVKFTGPVEKSEVEKITVKDSLGNALLGSWSSEFGNTEWMFAPVGMQGSTVYTVSVPASLSGDNGKAMGAEYVSSFVTEGASVINAQLSSNYVTVRPTELKNGENIYELSFRVTNNASNVAEVYAVNSTSDTTGTLVGSVNLKGAGYYSVDVTSYVADKVDTDVIFLIKAKKTAETKVIYTEDFSTSTGSSKAGSYTTISLENQTLRADFKTNKGAYVNSYYYPSSTTVVSSGNIIMSSNITEADYGRRFVVSFRIYDDISRQIRIQTTNSCSSSDRQTMDYERVIFNDKTVAGKWKTIEFEYVIYDSDYGASGNHKQGFTVLAMSDGKTETPLYFDDFTVTEIVSGIEIADASLVQRDDGGVPYKAPESENVFALLNGSTLVGEYASFKAVMNAYVSGYTVKLQDNYTLTDSELSDKLTGFAEVVIDLNGYKISSENTDAAFIWIKNTSTTVLSTKITVKNGEIGLKDTPAVAYDNSTAAGAGKKVNVDFENVTFTFLDSASLTEIISSSTVTAGSLLECNITLDECTLALDDSAHDYVPSTVLPEGAGDLSLHYTLIGGSFELSSLKLITIQVSAVASEFRKNSAGAYTTLVLPSVKPISDTAYLRDDGYSVYANGVSENGYSTYTLHKSEYSTKYGMIPEDYVDEEAYPLVVFDLNGNFLGASSFIAKDSGGGAFNFANKQKEGDWIVYLRRDLTHNEGQFNNIAFIYGSLLFDLGGHTVTIASGAGSFLTSHAKRANVTAITIKNGTIATGSKILTSFSSNVSEGNYDGKSPKTFDYTFDNVTFTNLTSTSLFKAGTANVPVNVNLAFKDCTFDTSASPDNFKLINLADTTNNLTAKVTVSGGVFKSDTFAGLNLFGTFNQNSSLEFVKNADMKYSVAQTTATDGTAPTDNIPTPEGNMLFGNGTENSGVTTYTLKENDLVTKYGTIPVEYADANTYPFAVFMNGEFVTADTRWSLALSMAKDKMYSATGVGKEMQILLRRDYTTNSSDGTNSIIYLIGGHVVLDLGDHTFTRGADAYLFDVMLRDTPSKADNTVIEKHDINITVKNGKILSEKAIVGLQRRSDTTYTTPKNFNATFDGVTVLTSSASAHKQVFVSWKNGNDVKGFASLKFNNCTFDLSSVRSDATLFDFDEDNGMLDVSVEIKGGNVIASAIDVSSAPKLYALEANDSLKFVKDAKGNYTTLTMPSGSSAPTKAYGSDLGNAGVMKFGKISADAINEVYTLVNLKTPYGTISDKYASPLDYPFVYFDANGNCKGASSTFYGEQNGIVNLAKDYLKGNVYDTEAGKYTGTILEAYIYMRGDYSLENYEYFNNLSQIQGELCIDLGGYTLSASSYGKVIFDATIKGWSGSGDALVFPSIMTIKNGTIVTKDKAVISFKVNTDSVADKLFTVNFNNVSFALSSTTTSANPLIAYTSNTYTGKAVVNFSDCVFDYKTVAPSSSVTVFNDSPSSTSNLSMEVNVNGGKLLISDLSKVTIGKTSSISSLTYGKGSDGKYLTLVLASTSSAPSSSLIFKTAVGDMVFKSSGAEGTTVIYTLIPTELKIVGAYLNITENVNVSYVVTLPSGYTAPYMIFEFNGDTYKVTRYTVNADGSLVFRFVGVTPQMLGDNIKATVYATYNGAEVTYEKAEYSVRTYCENMLAKTNDAKLITLLSDLLTYGAASQIFDDYKTDSLVNSGLTLTPSTFESVTSTDKALSGVAHDDVKWSGVSLRYENTMAMKFTFTAASDLVLKVTVNGRTTEYTESDFLTDKNGKSYVYFRGILATEYGDVVTASFFKGDTQVGQTVTYSVNSYVYSMQNSSDAALKALVQATYNYGASASAYVAE